MIAAITAGGLVDGSFSQIINSSVKALAPWGNGRLIDPSLNAARACGASRVVVVGGSEVRAHCGARADAVLEASEDGRINLERALRCAGEREALLLLTSDLPFITPAALEDFLRRIDQAELAMPLAQADSYARTYPGAANHAVRIGKERVVNGCAFYFSPGTAPRVVAIAQRFFAARKSLLRTASLLEAPLLLRFLFRRLRIDHLEAYAQRSFGIRARAVRDASPALCYDVDALEEYRYARSLLG